MTCRHASGAILCGRGAGRRRRRELPECRCPGCPRYATQASWGCRPHFFRLSPDLRSRLQLAERAELAANGRLGPAWTAVAIEADVWLAEQLAKPAVRPTWREPELPL